MDLIDKVVYINLDARKDRREEVEGELQRMGIAAERFAAIRTCPGIIGCGQSHSAVLKEAKARGYKNILILEDDFMFLVQKEEFFALLQTALKEVPDYDVIMLGYAINSSTPFSETLVKILNAQTTSGYLVSEKFYDTLISTWDESTHKLIQTGRHWEYACDHAWKALQPSAAWYAFATRIGKQRPSFADTGTAPVWAEYTNC